jgi:Uma2 family endonuclease
VDGEVRDVSPAGGIHGLLCGRFLAHLLAHAESNRLGLVFDSSTGFRMPTGNVRAPDVAFVSAARLRRQDVPAGFIPLVPDLVVEVLSPTDTARDVLDRVGEYLQGGTRLLWLVDVEARKVTVYRALSDVSTRSADDPIDGEDVVPGFSCRLIDLL